MKRLAWITDIHLDFLDRPGVDSFLRTLREAAADGILLSGDISVATDVAVQLKRFADALECSIYFVLGNHDYYNGSIAGVRQKISALCAACPTLIWLSETGVVPVSDLSGVVGHCGWGDGRLGDYWGSDVRLNDWLLIGDFVDLDDKDRLTKLHALGDEAAAHLSSVLPEALERFAHVIVVTHVPAFREACWHEGHISDDPWLPHFTCKAVGDVLARAMVARPDRQMTLVCGHTHGGGEAQILPNLKVFTGRAVYGQPVIQQVLQVD